MRNFFRAVVIGAGSYVGYLIARGVYGIFASPEKKAKLKKKWKKVKTAIKD